MDYLLTCFSLSAFWVAVLKVIGINIVLSGDNAVVIALACRGLPPDRRLWGMVIGAGAAVLLRIVFTLVIARAMEYPGLELAGGALLLWIAVKLAAPTHARGAQVKAADSLLRAVWIIVVADIVMSLDNVVAVAAAAQTAALAVDAEHAAAIKSTLIVVGLAISIPLIVGGSAILVALLERLPILAWAGGALLGWVAGDLMMQDKALLYLLPVTPIHDLHEWAAAAGALFVIALGFLLTRSRRRLPEDI